MADDVTTLLAIEEIKRLKARYFRHLDTKQWDKWGSVFTDDARLHMPDGPLDVQGRDVIVATVRELLGGVVTVHHGHMPEIDVVDAERATGIWAMFDELIYPPGEAVDEALPAVLRGYGHYAEEYRRTDDGWRISLCELTRLRVETNRFRRFLSARIVNQD
jgi:hypothetical protein